MSQTNIDVSGIALGQPGIPQPISDALLALQTGHNDTDNKLTNTVSGHNHDGSNSRLLTVAALSDAVAPSPWTLTAFNSDNTTPSSLSFVAADCRYIKLGKLVICWYYFHFTANPGFNAFLVPPVAPETSGKTAGVNIVMGWGEYQNASPGLGVFADLDAGSGRINIHLSTATQFNTTALGGFFAYLAA